MDLYNQTGFPSGGMASSKVYWFKNISWIAMRELIELIMPQEMLIQPLVPMTITVLGMMPAGGRLSMPIPLNTRRSWPNI